MNEVVFSSTSTGFDISNRKIVTLLGSKQDYLTFSSCAPQTKINVSKRAQISEGSPPLANMHHAESEGGAPHCFTRGIFQKTVLEQRRSTLTSSWFLELRISEAPKCESLAASSLPIPLEAPVIQMSFDVVQTRLCTANKNKNENQVDGQVSRDSR